MAEQPLEKRSIDELAVFFQQPGQDVLERIGRIKIIDHRKIETGELKGEHVDRLKRLLKQIDEEDTLELDLEEKEKDEDGNDVYVHKTKLVEKGDPLYTPAVRQYLRTKRFPTKPVKGVE